jgi:parallel beta-helix repeat protein
MTLNEARRILGLGPDEDPRPHLAEFHAARERIAELVRSSPNPVLAGRYQQGLVEFDQALAAVHEFLQAIGLESRPVAKPLPEAVAPAPAPTQKLDDPAPPERKSRASAIVAWALVLLTAAAGGAWFVQRTGEDKELNRQSRIALLERIGSEYLENRRWQEASGAFDEIEQLMPGSELAKLGRRSIEAGMDEEQNQFVGYWTGQAIAELEAGRPAEALAAINKVIERFPEQTEAKAILARIAAARALADRAAAVTAGRQLLTERRWNDALDAARALVGKHPDFNDAKNLLADAEAALSLHKGNQAKAGKLLAMAEARDQGAFDQQALDWLREAAALAPNNAEIAARLEKMASYTRTLRVPGDFATPAEALASARDRDRILISEQVWKGPLVIDAAIELQGVGAGKTIVECAATAAAAITIGPNAKGARVSGISFRHETFHAEGGERFSAALVRSGSATFADCHFTGASGHGLAVVEGGEALVSRCRFADNAWNGAAAIGGGSTLEIRDSEARDNFQNGIESWDGANVILANNRCEDNSRNGIHADNGAGTAIIEGNRLTGNREFGLVLGSAANGRATGNIVRSNLMGGMVVRKPAAAVTLTSNQVSLNEGPGLILEKGVTGDPLSSNKVEKNKGRNLTADAEL